jgi:DNA uptake protein ComE-like DNA-binding protein
MAALAEVLIERIGGRAGIGVGLAALLLTPRLARPLGRSLRVLAKGAIKGYLIVSYRARTAVNEAADEWLHVYEEARSAADGEAAGRNGRLVEAASAASLLGGETRSQEPRTRSPRDGRQTGRSGTRESARRPAKGREATSRRARRTAGAAPAGRVNLNEADRDALIGLPGIGERTADKILQYRAEHGRIGSLEELQEAAILFAATVERLRALVEV